MHDNFWEWMFWVIGFAVCVGLVVLFYVNDANKREDCMRMRCPLGMRVAYDHPYKSRSTCRCYVQPEEP